MLANPFFEAIFSHLQSDIPPSIKIKILNIIKNGLIHFSGNRKWYELPCSLLITLMKDSDLSKSATECVFEMVKANIQESNLIEAGVIASPKRTHGVNEGMIAINAHGRA